MIFNQLIPGELIQNQNIIIYITSIRTSENLYAYQVINLSKVDIHLFQQCQNQRMWISILFTNVQNFSRFLLIRLDTFTCNVIRNKNKALFI